MKVGDIIEFEDGDRWFVLDKPDHNGNWRLWRPGVYSFGYLSVKEVDLANVVDHFPITELIDQLY